MCRILLVVHVHNDKKKEDEDTREAVGCFVRGCRGDPIRMTSPISVPLTPQIIHLIEVEAFLMNAAGFWQKSILISLQLACNVPVSALAFSATRSLNRHAIHHF